MTDDGMGSGRDISGIATALLVSCVRQWGGDGALAEVLAVAAERRPLDVLEDERVWTSYPQFCRLLHAAAQVLDDPGVPRRIGEAALERQVGATVRMLLRALGSPESVYRSIPRTSAKIATVATSRCLEADERSARVAVRLGHGHAPDSAYRDFTMGLLAVVPCLFGLPAASATLHVAGSGGEWTVALQWPSRQRRGRRALRLRVELERREKAELADRLQTLQRTVADLVSPDGIEEVLARIAARSAFAVQAQQTVLAVRLEAGADPLVYADGLPSARAQQAGRALLDGAVQETPSTLVVDVASARRRYGRFLAANPSGHAFLEGERQLLVAYASLSAAALDAATALEEARSQGTTARELLGLAHSLASLTDAGSIASTLAGALTTLSGAERGTVFLWDPQAQALQLEANAGMPAKVDRRSRGLRITHRDTPELAAFLADPVPRVYERASVTDAFLAGLLETSGSAGAAVVPLMGAGDLLGAVVATWTEPSRQALDPDFQERLAGLADHGTSALRTARLVERMRHQALYDGLTRLPNRTLLTDRLALALARSARTGTRAAVLFCDLDGFRR